MRQTKQASYFKIIYWQFVFLTSGENEQVVVKACHFTHTKLQGF